MLSFRRTSIYGRLLLKKRVVVQMPEDVKVEQAYEREVTDSHPKQQRHASFLGTLSERNSLYLGPLGCGQGWESCRPLPPYHNPTHLPGEG